VCILEKRERESLESKPSGKRDGKTKKRRRRRRRRNCCGAERRQAGMEQKKEGQLVANFFFFPGCPMWIFCCIEGICAGDPRKRELLQAVTYLQMATPIRCTTAEPCALLAPSKPRKSHFPPFSLLPSPTPRSL
jgi:hypothetical protein